MLRLADPERAAERGHIQFRLHRERFLSQSRNQLLRVNSRVRSRAFVLLEEFQAITEGMMAGTPSTLLR